MNTPFFAIGNEELDATPEIEDGEKIVCPICSGIHIVKFSSSNTIRDVTIGTYRCGKKSYLAAIDGKLIGNAKIVERE